MAEEATGTARARSGVPPLVFSSEGEPAENTTVQVDLDVVTRSPFTVEPAPRSAKVE
ncbi:hypothetical protein [Amycolatopsis anabasis]|uniref:hypothetical protein n=1 Tax=Amycolatopsis anabasis TaxID=1840409 RepID=UPI00131E63DD|nr:hypothetical protein [Amycolatopsis anabasis]